MTPVIVKYPLDPTGVNPNNLVQGEVHTMVRRKVRAIATIYGAFFTQSLKVVDTATNLELVRGTQYHATEMYELPTKRYGKEICAVILITDEAVSDNVSVQYQALGGEFSTSMTAITQLLENLALDERPLEWASVIDKPTEFPPAHHLHDAGDTYGWEYVVHALDRVRQAVEQGDRLAHDAIYRYVDATLGDVSTEVIQYIQLAVSTGLTAHNAAADPHSQYLLKTDAANLTMAAVRTPQVSSPLNGATNVMPDVTLTLGVYYSLYNVAQKAAQFQLSQNPDCSAPYVFDTVQGAVNSYHHSTLLASNTQYYWRGRYQDNDNVWSDWSVIQGFQTATVGIVSPSLTSPSAGATVTSNGIAMTSSAFATMGGVSDTWTGIEWEIWTGPGGTGTRVFHSLTTAPSTLSLSVNVPTNTLANNTTYYPRVRHMGNTLGVSAWSANQSFATNYPLLPTTIGESFQGGYYAGDVNYSGNNYAILVAPKATGEGSYQLSSSTADYSGDDNNSGSNTLLLKSMGSQAANFATGLTIGGNADWYIPAISVLSVIGTNLDPDRTDIPVIFRTGGSEALQSAVYWSSSPITRVVDESYNDPDVPVYTTIYGAVHTYDESEYHSANYSGNLNFFPTPHASEFPNGNIPGEPGYRTDNSWPNSPSPQYTVTDRWNGDNGYTGPIPASQRYEHRTFWWVYYDNLDPSSSGYLTGSQWQYQELTGYQPGEYHEVINTYYDAKTYSFSSNAAGYSSKTASRLVRAVRLIPK